MNAGRTRFNMQQPGETTMAIGDVPFDTSPELESIPVQPAGWLDLVSVVPHDP